MINKEALYFAIEHNDVEALKFEIEQSEIEVCSILDDRQGTLAHVAARQNKVDIIRYLAEKDPSIVKMLVTMNRTEPWRTATEEAIAYNALAVVKYLFGTDGFNKDVCDDAVYLEFRLRGPVITTFGSYVHLAIKYGHLDIVKYFIEERGVNNEKPCRHARDPPLVFTALKYQQHDIIKYLIDVQKVDLTALDGYEENILFEAVRDNHLEFITYVFDEKRAKLDVNHKNSGNRTLLHLAALYNRLNILEYLVVQKHANVNYPKGSYTPLHCASSKKHFRAVRFLIEHGADVNRRDEYGNTALFCAASERIGRYLIERGADVNMHNSTGWAPLHVAASKNFHKLCEDLINKGADIDVRDDAGSTPLQRAVRNTKVSDQLCQYLINKGADVNKKNKYGQTALQLAVSLGRYNVSTYLVEHGAHVNEENKRGETALHSAILKGYLKLCQYLIEHDADVNKDVVGTAMHLAAATNQIVILDYLVGRKRNDVNVTRTRDMWTPLHCAASGCKYDAFTYLIEHGANAQAKDKHGKTPAEIASDERIIAFMNSRAATIRRRRRNVPPSSNTGFRPYNHIHRQKVIDGVRSQNLHCNGGSSAAPMFFGSVFHLQNLLTLFGLLMGNLRPFLDPGYIFGAENMDPVAEDAINTFPLLEDEMLM